MKKTFLIIFISLLSCSKDENESDDLSTDNFLCTVDYVEILDDSNAIVKFTTTLGDVTRPYYGRYTYKKTGNDYFIGDDLVNILNFNQIGNSATFVFEYGDNLGFFCAQLFETLPEHIHYTFDAEAELSISGKTVGKWKIKKRSNFREKNTLTDLKTSN